ncbi:MAG: hypothetical protein ACRC24_08375 [Vibrionaceae bacterium]
MQPAPITGANGAAQAQGAAGGGQPPQATELNITAVHNAPGVNPEMLGDWTIETSAQVQAQANITLCLQRRIPAMEITAENQQTLHATPSLQSLRVGAEAIIADFTVEALPQQEDAEPQNYHLDGFADDNHIALKPISEGDRQRLEQCSSEIVYQTTLNAMEVLTNANVTIETHEQQTLTAKQLLNEVKFRRTLAPELRPEPRFFTSEAEQAAAESQHNNAIKQRLLEIIQNSQYCFDPADAAGNTTKIEQNWTLCYYQGTTPVPANMPTKVNIEYQLPGNTTSSLYADFWQNGLDGEDGLLTLIENRLTLTPDGEISKSARPLQVLPGDSQSFPEMLEQGVTILHLDNKTFIIRTNKGEILGLADLD